jgi:heavy metal sensor kinase
MSSKIGARLYRRTDVRVTLWYLLTFLLCALIICGFLYYRLRTQLVKEIDRFLLDEIRELSGALSGPDDLEAFRQFEIGLASRTYYPIVFRVLDREGAPIYTSEGFGQIRYRPNQNLALSLRRGEIVREEMTAPETNRVFRVVSAPSRHKRSDYVLQMGTDLYLLRKSLGHFRENILAALPVMLALGAFGGWWLARRSLLPIGYIASKARQITERNLGERLITTGAGDDLDILVQTINGMIARLENSFRRLAEFTADASHELKTPLCAMRGEAEILLLRGRTPDEYQEGLSHFIEQFDRMNAMINNLILLSKADSAQEELNLAPLRLDLVLNDLCQFFKLLAEQNGIALEVGPIQEALIAGDKTRIQQLFTNLIDNAIKYTARGSVRVILERDAEFARARIIDTGIGIPPEEQAHIFKRFYRVDKSRSKETGGTGLGLSIAEWIATSHRGRIDLASELHRGSTFTVYLPLLGAGRGRPA